LIGTVPCVANGQSGAILTDFPRSLTRHGLRETKLVITDDSSWAQAAIAKIIKATRQRCRVKFMRNAIAYAGTGQRKVVLALMNTVFAAIRC
jgi:putative transposase